MTIRRINCPAKGMSKQLTKTPRSSVFHRLSGILSKFLPHISVRIFFILLCTFALPEISLISFFTAVGILFAPNQNLVFSARFMRTNKTRSVDCSIFRENQSQTFASRF
jgi:hypothetical protein